MRFKCGVGVYIPKTGNYIFAGDLSSYARKHTGKADEEAISMIQTQLNMANAHYADLLASRDILINQTASLYTYSKLVGEMFIDKQCLNKEQVSSVRDSLIGKVVLFDDMDHTNAWNFYNCVATALRMSHPKNWFEDQSECHKVINKYFALTTLTQGDCDMEFVQEPVQEIVQPTNQLSLLDVIDEVERKEEELKDYDISENIDNLTLDLMYEEGEAENVTEIVNENKEENLQDEEEFFNFGNEELPTFHLPDL
jgi:hypothetical protein